MSSAAESMVGAVCAIAVTTFLLVVLLPALRRRVVDLPNHRSSHTVPTPRGAGAALVVGLLLGALTASAWSEHRVRNVLIATALLAVLGFADDLRGLKVGVRFGGQTLVATALSLAVIRPDAARSWVAVGCAAFVVVGFTNAFNFMDGINGISAFNAVVASAWFAWVASDVGEADLMRAAIALAAALVAFIPWNYPNAKVFLGDVGSYALGCVLAGFALVLWRANVPVWACVAPLLIYISDTGFTLTRRIVGRRPWREAHREHVYQRLVDGGLSHRVVAPAVAGWSLAVCFAWHSLHSRSEVAALVLMLMVCGAYLATPSLVLGERVTAT